MTAPTFDLDAIEQAAKEAGSDLQRWRVDGDQTKIEVRDRHIAFSSPTVVLAMCARLRWAEALWFEIGVLMKHRPEATKEFPRLAALLAERADL